MEEGLLPPDIEKWADYQNREAAFLIIQSENRLLLFLKLQPRPCVYCNTPTVAYPEESTKSGRVSPLFTLITIL